jgi:hypothetical protein
MTNETSPTGRLARRYQAWKALQSHRRLQAFYSVGAVGFLIWAVICVWLGTHAATMDQEQKKATAVGMTTSIVLFLVLWPLLTLKWRSTDVGGRKVPPVRLFCWWLISLWLSLFASVAGTHAQSAAAPATAAIGASAGVPGQGATASPQWAAPQNCVVVWFYLFFAGLALAFILWLLFKLGFIGGHGAHPPQHGGGDGGDNDNARAHGLTSTTEPVTTFYLSGGIVISNSAGLMAPNTLPSFLNAPAGGKLDFSQSSPVGIWKITNNVYDADLDTNYPYTTLVNYSVLSSTNLVNWSELCTVVEYANQNPSVPLSCVTVYTNGVAVSTNWVQAYLDRSGQPTNIVVHGALLAIGAAPTVTANNGAGWAPGRGPKPLPAGGPSLPLPPPPPGGGDTNTDYTPLSVDAHYYKLVYSTNDVVTSWQ